MLIDIIPKEETLEESERWFVDIIKYIENETRDEEARLALFATYNRGFKNVVSLFYHTVNRIEYTKDPLCIYILGVKESIYIIEEMINEMLQLIDQKKIELGEESISFIQAYMKGIKKAADLDQRNKLNGDIIKVVEDIDTILSAYKGKDPEEVWENIRKRIGVSIEF